MAIAAYETNPDAVDHLVLECGAAGYSKAQIAACLGVSKRTLKTWAATYERFADALERAETLAQSWWEGQAMNGGAQSRIGGTVWHKSMAARFPEDYADRIEQGEIGETGRVTKIEWEVVDVAEEGAV